MKTVASVIGISIVVAATAYAQSTATPPTETQGLDAVVAHQNGLEAQIPAMSGFDFRGRKITLLPGAATVEHSHAERPGIVYVIEGKVNEYRNGEKREFAAGDTWIETADTVHWVQNPTKNKAVIFMVDLPVQQ